jgi:hypothetical protein
VRQAKPPCERVLPPSEWNGSAIAETKHSSGQEFPAHDPSGLVALEEGSPAIKDLTFDIDGLAVSKAETKLEDTPVKMVIMGDAYLQREKSDKPDRFVCLIGEKGKVLLTFFTEQ